MTLTALLSAQMPSGDGAGHGLAALLPMAGLTLLERQAEEAAAVGISQLMVLVDAVPGELTAAIDRIRSRGIAVAIVRDGGDVIAAMGASGASRMLLVADRLVAPRGLWEALAGASAPRLLAVGDTPATAALERIDAQCRWAGLATVEAGAIAALAHLPPDWDPQLALLRGAIQAGAPAILCEPQLFERGDVALLDTVAAADLVEQRLLAKGSEAVTGLVHANLAMPVARAGARWLLRGQQGGVVARVLAMLSASGAGLAMLLGQPALAAGAALLAVLASAVAATIATFRPAARIERWLARVGDTMLGGALLAAGWHAARSDTVHGPAWLATGLALVLLGLLGRLLAKHSSARPALLWDDGATWLVVGVGTMVAAWPLALVAALPLGLAAALFAVWKNGARNAV